MSKHKPFLIVVSAPSGCGKTSILQLLMTRLDGLGFSVSHTTRPKRTGETTGADYHFVTTDTFLKMKANGGFVESAFVHSNHYGTSLDSIEQLLSSGVDAVLDIDVQGMLLLRDASQFDFVSIFILPPSLVELENRLRNRKTDLETVIISRINNAVDEIRMASEYDYCVVNDKLEIAVDDVMSIIKAERLRSERLI